MFCEGGIVSSERSRRKDCWFVHCSLKIRFAAVTSTALGSRSKVEETRYAAACGQRKSQCVPKRLMMMANETVRVENGCYVDTLKGDFNF